MERFLQTVITWLSLRLLSISSATPRSSTVPYHNAIYKKKNFFFFFGFTCKVSQNLPFPKMLRFQVRCLGNYANECVEFSPSWRFFVFTK